jgi:pentatricopeptide repeat protein
MTIIAYSALMKVYSYCNMYSEACDLYEQLTSEGYEPDSMMYGCLMKFSAECGRTELTRELSAKIGVSCKKLGVHHHMSLIRAAGQDKDVDKAFAVLQQFRKDGGIDTAICNAVLDVCCSAGDMDRARGLLVDMKKEKLIDIISFNTLIKGYCRLGNPRQANEVLADMEKVGIQPNDVSYNCLINLAASAGDFRVAWKTIETMEQKSIRIDHYTVSTLLKALKRAPSGKEDIGRVMDLLDRHHIDVCCEEVLLNTALEACMKHGEHRRLERLLENMKTRAGMQLAAHTYASLIKAAGSLKQIQRCRDLWADMTELRRIQPTGVALGCILDALVCNGCVLEGVSLFREWEDRVEVNTILYSTLIKGFNNIGDARGAVDMWNELRKKALPLNSMVYNAIIDVHARTGNTSAISALLKSMEADNIEADSITRSIVAKGFCMAGELDKAMDLLRKAPIDSKTNNVIIFNTILDGCVRHDRMELADELLAKMQSFNVTPTNFTLGIIVKMWGRRRKMTEAFNAVRTLPKQYGFTANPPVKTCLLFACLRNEKVSSALEIFEELCASGHRPDTKMLSALVNNCAKIGNSERAIVIVEEAYGLSSGRRMLARGEQLEPLSLEQLMKCLARKGELQTLGAPLLKKIVNAKIPVSNHILSMVMDTRDSV